MTFVSLTFVVFLICVLLASRIPMQWRTKKAILLAASYVFYAAWNPPFVLLLLGSTAVDWVLAKRIHASTDDVQRKRLLGLSLLVNLGVLAGFKYATLAVSTASDLMGKTGADAYSITAIILPVGISFYTFQTLSYSIDVYRRRLKPADDVVDYALYVSFFPQLVAGPIVRAETFLPQCREEHRASVEQVAWGLSLFIFGLFMKMVFADALFAPASEAVFGVNGALSSTDAWVGTLAFTGQILCDFSGYSLCAIGVAAALGFQLPDNFHRPYAAIGFSDFWRRWHISLSTWLRDYLYIPLGGNRHGTVRTALALSLTMWLGGLWHGAAWTFLAWGVLHGAFLVIERGLKAKFGGAGFVQLPGTRIALGALTFALVVIAWVPFRAPSFSRAGEVWKAMAFAGPAPPQPLLTTAAATVPLVALVVLLVAQIVTRNHRLPELAHRIPLPVRAIAIAVCLFSLLLAPADDRAFLYFQF